MTSEALGAHFIRTGVLSLAVTCALASMQAQAVGLGTIEVKSKLDQPFVAEIRLTLNNSDEANDLVVRMASPEAFARVGMDPNELSANLQFSIGRNARGEPVVRVTTPQRMSDPYVTFLLEADWGNGKMVREYTALLDPPHTVSVPRHAINSPTVASTPLPTPAPAASVALPAEPQHEMPIAAASLPAPAPPAAPKPDVVPPSPQAAPVSETPVPEPIAAAPQAEPIPAPEAIASPQPEAAPVARTEPNPAHAPGAPRSNPDAVTVNKGETLSSIAGQVRGEVSVNRMMIALQRANPDAFIGNNINLLKSGAVLRIPGTEQAQAITVAEANALVHEQVESWRQGTQPAPQLQPEETAGNGSMKPATSANPTGISATGRPTKSADKAANGYAGSANTVSGTAPKAGAAGAAKPRGAHLEIVPPSGSASATSQSGASEGGSGSELRAQLAQTKEELTARNSEIGDLKSRVADLEKIQTDSQKLLSMKDSQLAAMQQRLAELEKSNATTPPANAGPASVASSSPAASGNIAPASGSSSTSPAAATIASTAPATTAGVPPKPAVPVLVKPSVATPQQTVEPTPWYLQPFVLIGGVLIAIAGLLALLLKRPRKVVLPPRARSFNTSALAASMTAARAGDGAQAEEIAATDASPYTPPAPVLAEAEAEHADDLAIAPTPAPAQVAPPQVALAAVAPVAQGATAQRPAFRPVDESKQSVATKLELARAYMEIGDADGARGMLEKVLIEGNALQQEEAFKILDVLDG